MVICFAIPTCPGWQMNCENIRISNPANSYYHMYKDLMINQQLPWIEIRGDYEERLQKAIHFTV